MSQTTRHSQAEDAGIARLAEHWLRWNPSLSMTDIHVGVHNGRVALTGEVSWDYQRVAAEATLRHIVGVSAVSNELQVGLKSAKPKSSVAKHSARKQCNQFSSFADLCNKIGDSLPH